MSLSRPARFPVLKLPLLCIESVIKSSDIFDIVYFALISKRTRRIVKHLKVPLNNIKIHLSDGIRWIDFYSYSKIWCFWKTREKYVEPPSEDLRKDPLVLQSNAIPMYTSKADHALNSYTDEDEITALKMAMEFLNEIFKCSVEQVEICGGNFPEAGCLGVKTISNLSIPYRKSQPFGDAQFRKLNLLLENLEVTGECTFSMSRFGIDFHCDPKLLKCKRLVLRSCSTERLTGEIILQFEVPQLYLNYFLISVGDIGSFITQWFHSDNRKLEYLYIGDLRTRIYLEEFRRWNALPFSGKISVPSSDSSFYIYFFKGLEIFRHDGLQATIHVDGGSFLFYIRHDQPAITQN